MLYLCWYIEKKTESSLLCFLIENETVFSYSYLLCSWSKIFSCWLTTEAGWLPRCLSLLSLFVAGSGFWGRGWCRFLSLPANRRLMLTLIRLKSFRFSFFNKCYYSFIMISCLFKHVTSAYSQPVSHAKLSVCWLKNEHILA